MSWSSYSPRPYTYFGTLGEQDVWIQRDHRIYHILVGEQIVGTITREGRLYRAPDGSIGNQLYKTLRGWLERKYEGLSFQQEGNLRAHRALPNLLVALEKSEAKRDTGTH